MYSPANWVNSSHEGMHMCPAGAGILRTAEFAERLQWQEQARPAPLADILRVHEWAYVRQLQRLCAAIPDDPAAIGQLDGDTAVSHGTFRAALVAAGAVCDAVDQVVSGQVGSG